MSIWLELRCDIEREGRDPDNIAEHFCFNHKGRTPALLAGSDSAELFKGLSSLTKEAKAAKWEKLTETKKWACPNCASLRKRPVMLKAQVVLPPEEEGVDLTNIPIPEHAPHQVRMEA